MFSFEKNAPITEKIIKLFFCPYKVKTRAMAVASNEQIPN